MPELKLVEGRLSEYYNHFEEYSFVSCQATATRLMGVIAMISARVASGPRKGHVAGGSTDVIELWEV